MIGIRFLSVTAVAAFAVFLSARESIHNQALCPYISPHGSAERQEDAAARFNTTTFDGVSLCSFSDSYFEAREKFRNIAADLSMDLYSLPVVKEGAKVYSMDVAVLHGKGDGIVIHSSGVHGVEGYAGSAIQVAMMEHLSKHPEAREGMVPTLVFVHAVNPYGMQHNRRFNENNVDLNRNALHEDEWPAVLNRDRNIAMYDDFDKILFNPAHAPTLLDANVLIWPKALYGIISKGFLAMKRSIVAAQYHKPSGIYYGGQELEPSHRLLRDFIVDHFVDPKSRGTVTWIDVHTGLGPSGVDTLLPKSMDGDDPKLAVKETKKWFPGIAVDDAGDSSVGAGYDMTVGFSGSFYTRLFHKDRRALFITQEFGTLPGLFVARAMILENQAFVYAPHLQPEWSQYTKDAFYVQKPAWRRSVLDRGLQLLSNAIRRSSAET
eukprot:g87.t1